MGVLLAPPSPAEVAGAAERFQSRGPAFAGDKGRRRPQRMAPVFLARAIECPAALRSLGAGPPFERPAPAAGTDAAPRGWRCPPSATSARLH